MTTFFALVVFLAVIVFTEGNTLSRIIGGVNVEIEKHPWQASLRRSNSHICGASFIDNMWLVTAAHCLNNQDVSLLSIGYGHMSKSNHKVANINQVFMHPDYTEDGSRGYPDDIALIQLTAPVEFNAQTNKISLPSSDINAPFFNCYITGWGCTSNIAGFCFSTPDILQETTMSVLTKEECNSLWTSIEILDKHICVSEAGKSGCSGDSGGPLSCDQNGVKVLAGATSWGSSTCSTSTPTVYARVSQYVSWIREITKLDI